MCREVNNFYLANYHVILIVSNQGCSLNFFYDLRTLSQVDIWIQNHNKHIKELIDKECKRGFGIGE